MCVFMHACERNTAYVGGYFILMGFAGGFFSSLSVGMSYIPTDCYVSSKLDKGLGVGGEWAKERFVGNGASGAAADGNPGRPPRWGTKQTNGLSGLRSVAQ